MPDLMCPPLTNMQHPCACRPVRYGVALLAMGAYSTFYAQVFFGKPFAAVVGPVLRGDVPVVDMPIKWMACALFGVLCLGGGIYRIYTEGHDFKAGSFLWSVGVVAAVLWRLTHYPNCIGEVGWFGLRIDAFDFHVTRMLLVAWLASNAANIALQLIEVWRRRPRVPRRNPALQPVSSGLLHHRRVTTALIEEIESDGIAAENLARHLGQILPADVLRAVEHGGDVPLIDLVPQDDGSFIPAQQPQREAVPVKRRR